MLVGYARTSTTEQKASITDQVRLLEDAGCEKIFSEEVSAVAKVRPKFEEARNFVREGDVLVVCKLDRLARSIAHLVEINEEFTKKKVALKVLNNSGIDTSTATGRLMFSVIGAIAEFERDLLLERQRVGIERAKNDGKYIGRFPAARNQAARVLELHKNGTKPSDIAKQLGIGRSSVYALIARGETFPVVQRRRTASVTASAMVVAPDTHS
jgi:DNA invertase Pin-like site-specific DNA recombinase